MTKKDRLVIRAFLIWLKRYIGSAAYSQIQCQELDDLERLAGLADSPY